VEGEGHVEVLERRPERLVGVVVELPERAIQRVRAAEDAAQTELVDGAACFDHRGHRILHGQGGDADQPAAIRGAEFRDPFVVDPARGDGELGVVDGG
jgi:hypothetical protein